MKTLSQKLIRTCLSSRLSFCWISSGPRYLTIICLLFISTIVIASCNKTSHEAVPVLHRLILVKYKAEVTDAQIEEGKQVFLGLKEKVPGMLDVIFAQDLKFNRKKPYTHVLLLSFSSEEAMKAYEEHPDHKALQKEPNLIENFFMMDYWTGIDKNNETITE
jgi:hypothetical protein